jgi:cell division protein FtsI (penicillin-binding protein 3)
MPQTGQRTRIGQVLIGLVCVLFVALIGRLIYIQVEMRPELLKKARRVQYSEVKIPGRRGAILDRRYRVMAGSEDKPLVFADPFLIDDHAAAARKLAPVLNLPAREIQKLLDNPSSPRYVVLKRSVPEVEIEALQELDLSGVSFRNVPQRTYPMETMAAQVIGFVGADRQGLEGLELSWDEYLRAEPGKRVVFCGPRRRALYQQIGSYQPPENGLHVVLNIDAAIQEIVQRELGNQVDHYEAEWGVGVCMNPQTGQVLALANYPSFDPADAGSSPKDVRRNRALTDPVEPGSVFKPFVMAAALAEGVTHPDEVIDCERGMYRIGGRRLHDAHAYTALTTSKVLIKSSNIGMAKLGLRLGNEKIYTHMRDFGFGQKTGIDLPGEGVGMLLPLSRWTSYSTTSLPMGQEIAVTPIQLATALSAIVNGGKLLTPRVVRSVMNEKREIVEDYSRPEVRRRVLDEKIAAQVCKMMTGVVSPEGTGRRVIMDDYTAMGKTGTAQVPYENRRGYEPGAYMASFIGAAPATDPQIVVVVMIRKPNPRIGYYGGLVSGPAVKAIFEQTLPYLGVPPDKPAEGHDMHLADGDH